MQGVFQASFRIRSASGPSVPVQGVFQASYRTRSVPLKCPIRTTTIAQCVYSTMSTMARDHSARCGYTTVTGSLHPLFGGGQGLNPHNLLVEHSHNEEPGWTCHKHAPAFNCNHPRALAAFACLVPCRVTRFGGLLYCVAVLFDHMRVWLATAAPTPLAYQWIQATTRRRSNPKPYPIQKHRETPPPLGGRPHPLYADVGLA